MTDTSETGYLKPEEVSKMARVSVAHLAQLRFRGTGPKFLKPTPRTVLYREADVRAWLEASEQTMTGAGAA
ncbi:helix-turn-helix transcriptional regulator [Herbiconiux sp. YIM B11900]|uniref:helix-turn-helix transcriptional regulator n=1 Tax=Herbiconiux sp. YIM B11900 TaxID=3404131 RepID=UPI003F87CD83